MKKNEKKWKEKHVWKVKTKLSTSLILKKNLTKIILKKNMWGNTVAKQKPCGDIVTIYSVLKKKSTKQNSQPSQYKKNIDKDHFEKQKKNIHKKTM
jgi:hypothetical protein